MTLGNLGNTVLFVIVILAYFILVRLWAQSAKAEFPVVAQDALNAIERVRQITAEESV